MLNEKIKTVVLKRVRDNFELAGISYDASLWGEEKITTEVAMIVTDCGVPQLEKVFNTRIEGRSPSRMKAFKDLFRSVRKEILREAKMSEFPRLIVKFINKEGYLVDKKEYWIEFQ